MLKSTIQNGPLMSALARLGHGDMVVVADCGLPCPPGVPIVDLAVTRGVPTFEQALRALCADVVFEAATLAEEASGWGAEALVEELVGGPLYVTHDVLKELTMHAAVIVRTGEVTAFSNVILVAGVDF